MVSLQNGKIFEMSELQVGDQVKTGLLYLLYIYSLIISEEFPNYKIHS